MTDVGESWRQWTRTRLWVVVHPTQVEVEVVHVTVTVLPLSCSTTPIARTARTICSTIRTTTRTTTRTLALAAPDAPAAHAAPGHVAQREAPPGPVP